MKNRKKRIDLIIELIKTHCIGSQEELSSLLNDKGYQVTQATLSRDLKMLRTTKVPTDRGTYMYVLPESDSLKDKILFMGQSPVNINFQSGFISIAKSGNIVVIKTRNGYASGLAYDIDMARFPEILGTIPGSDTIFAIVKQNVTDHRVAEIFSSILNIDLSEINFNGND